MGWDIRNSRVVPWLGVVGTAIAIGQVAIKVSGSTGFVDSLFTPVPVWVLLVGVLPLTPLTLLAAKRTIQTTEIHNKVSDESAQPNLESQVRDCVNERAALQAKLDNYESLEKQILGFLASDVEIATSDLLSHLSISHNSTGRQNLHLVLASLEQKGEIVGTGSTLPKLKRAPKLSG